MARLGDGEGLRPRRGPLGSSVLRVWRRRRLLGVLIGAVFVSVALLQGSLLPLPPGYQQILVNLGASFLGVVATVLVLEPLIERSRTPEEVIHSEFPYERFLTGVDRSAYQVRILGAWPYAMDHPWRERFLAALSGARGGASPGTGLLVVTRGAHVPLGRPRGELVLPHGQLDGQRHQALRDEHELPPGPVRRSRRVPTEAEGPARRAGPSAVRDELAS